MLATKVKDPNCYILRESFGPSCSAEAKLFTEIDEDMQEYYNSVEQILQNLPYKGTTVVVKYDRFCRAEVRSILSTSTVPKIKVYLLDFGKECTVSRQNVYEIQDQFLTCKFQAVEFRLGLEPFSMKINPVDASPSFGPVDDWDSSAINFIQNLMKKINSAQVLVKGIHDCKLYGELHVQTSEGFSVNVNMELVSRKFAQVPTDLWNYVKSIDRLLHPNVGDEIQPKPRTKEVPIVGTGSTSHPEKHSTNHPDNVATDTKTTPKEEPCMNSKSQRLKALLCKKQTTDSKSNTDYMENKTSVFDHKPVQQIESVVSPATKVNESPAPLSRSAMILQKLQKGENFESLPNSNEAAPCLPNSAHTTATQNHKSLPDSSSFPPSPDRSQAKMSSSPPRIRTPPKTAQTPPFQAKLKTPSPKRIESLKKHVLRKKSTSSASSVSSDPESTKFSPIAPNRIASVLRNRVENTEVPSDLERLSDADESRDILQCALERVRDGSSSGSSATLAI